MTSTRSINFSAGPSALPPSVLAEATAGLLDFAGTGIGIAEISHRSKEFMAFLDETEALIREQLQVPSTHRVLFAQGGGTGQFAAVVLNLLARDVLVRPTLAEGEERVLDYVLTGSWSKAALKEAQQLTAALPGVRLNTVVDAKALSPNNAYDRTPPHSAYNFSPDPALIFYCENETVNGVQFSKASESDVVDETGFPFHLLPKGKLLPLVADYSSSFMSRPIPRLADHAVIYAGAQKNIAPAGLTILIVREDCLVDTAAAALLGAPPVPSVLSYKYLSDGKSVPNTPPVFSIYVAGLVLRRMKALGGLEAFEDVNRRKKESVYRAIREGEERGVFRGKGAGERGMKSLKGHRSVGGIRASLYNAVEEEEVEKLVEYMREFVEAETTA
ncbi:hypothetical protein D9611_004255 [Ephemerocybe angulata]|uniref:phosphoserine transaminase n=1 Tax=Ephemerocybe angulata TaxID=980116 RepID=A0A8H5BK14_9AGAR|nr:hypothetical protein D9611_004255 [Tulosesus angulatus]